LPRRKRSHQTVQNGEDQDAHDHSRCIDDCRRRGPADGTSARSGAGHDLLPLYARPDDADREREPPRGQLYADLRRRRAERIAERWLRLCLRDAIGCFGRAGYATIYNANFKGTFIGDIDTLTVNLYVSGIRANSGSTNNVNTILGIDGKSMFGTTTTTTGTVAANSKAATVKPVATSTPGLWKLEFSVYNIGFVGDAGAEHTVQLSVNISTDPATLVFLDTTDTPSGITFSPIALAAAKLKATTPGPA